MVLPQAMAWVQYWFRILSLKFCRKSKKNCGDISQVSPAFCMYDLRVFSASRFAPTALSSDWVFTFKMFWAFWKSLLKNGGLKIFNRLAGSDSHFFVIQGGSQMTRGRGQGRNKHFFMIYGGVPNWHFRCLDCEVAKVQLWEILCYVRVWFGCLCQGSSAPSHKESIAQCSWQAVNDLVSASSSALFSQFALSVFLQNVLRVSSRAK